MARGGARWAFLVVATLLLLLQPFWGVVAHSRAEATASLTSSQPTITTLGSVSANSSLGLPDCNQAKINVVRNVLNNFIANEEQHCLYTTLYGLTDGTIIQPNGFGKAYPIEIIAGGNPFLQPIPNQESMLYEVGDRSFPGMDVGLYKNFYQHLHFNVLSQHFDLSDPPDMIFRYGDNRQIAFNTIHFSSNGQFILADLPHQGFVKIDLSNLTLKPVASALPLINNFGLLGASSTIDDEGRYAAIAYAAPGGWGDPFFKIIDTDSCTTPMPSIVYEDLNTNCVTVDDQAWLKQHIASLQSVQGVSFENQATLLFDATVGGDLTRYALTPAGTTPRLEEYLAMGDSYVSGEGAFSYREGTDASTNKCHQSTLSYPYLIGIKHFDSFASVACSAAMIDNILGDDKYNRDDQINSDSAPTLTTQAAAEASHAPGVVLQKNFVSQDNPNVVTISIGGNDVGFSNIIKRCILPFNMATSTSQNCYQTYEDRLELVDTINDQFNRLVLTYQAAIANDPTRRVYVIGYPQVVSATGQCGVNVRLSAADRLFANQLIDYLDSVIEKAAKKAGVFYIDTQQALAGHELCESGTPAMNGLTAGDDKVVIGNESYHPNALGQQLLGDAIMAKTHSLTVAMPAASQNAPNPTASDSLAILQAPKINRPIYNVLNAGEDLLLLSAGGSMNFVAGQFEGVLAPNANFNAVLHSDPTDLGTVKTDSRGGLRAQLAIPAGTQPGFHALHFYGKDIAGNAVDIQQTVYLKATAYDFDGDGVVNESDSCKYLPNSRLDIDQDGVDDTCDTVVSDPPVVKIGKPDAVAPLSVGVSSLGVDQKALVTDARAQSTLPTVTAGPAAGVAQVTDSAEPQALALGREPGTPTKVLGTSTANSLVDSPKQAHHSVVWYLAIALSLAMATWLAVWVGKRRS